MNTLDPLKGDNDHLGREVLNEGFLPAFMNQYRLTFPSTTDSLRLPTMVYKKYQNSAELSSFFEVSEIA